MRGALTHKPPDSHPCGIIPAYAGSTFYLTEQARTFGDHPRVCGEHQRRHIDRCPAAGSSPRMRGAPSPAIRSCHCIRIIPAYAGSTTPEIVSPCNIWDHPRVCGEHRVGSSKMKSISGSSPRMRGAHEKECQERVQPRIIPAYAGSTIRKPTCPGSSADHPRVCGEHFRCAWRGHAPVGSSPRMRGALGIGIHGHPLAGIIPAYAGSTCPGLARTGGRGDHPRVCGEHAHWRTASS